MKTVDLRVHNHIENGIVVTIQYSAGVWGCIVTQSLFSSGHDWQFVKEDDLKPIKLSPEWLERLGFEQYNEAFWRFKDSEGWFLNSDGEVTKSLSDFYVRCDSVHSLQNLIYALTGTELTLKP